MIVNVDRVPYTKEAFNEFLSDWVYEIEQDQEFSKGDQVTFNSYGKAIKAKVSEVHNGFNMFGKDNRISYKLTGIETGRPLNTQCTGNSILESKYFRCLERVFIIKNDKTGDHYIVKSDDFNSAFNEVCRYTDQTFGNDFSHVNNFDQLHLMAETVQDVIKNISGKKEVKNITIDLIEVKTEKGSYHLKSVLNGLACHITEFDHHGNVVKNDTLNKKMFTWWNQSKSKITVLNGGA